MSFFRKFLNYFNPAGDTTTAEQAARIEAARLRNGVDFGSGAEIGARLGLNQGETDQAVRAYRQVRAQGLWSGTLEQYIQHRIDTGIVRPGQ